MKVYDTHSEVTAVNGAAQHNARIRGNAFHVVDTTNGLRLQVSFGNETALIYPWQIVKDPR